MLGKPLGRKIGKGLGCLVVPKAQHPGPGLTGMLKITIPRLWQGRTGTVEGVL